MIELFGAMIWTEPTMDDSLSMMVLDWLIADAALCPCNGVVASDVETTSIPSYEYCSVIPLGGRGDKC